MSSERLHGIVPQPEAKCPLIDKMLKKVEKGFDCLNDAVEAETLEAAINAIDKASCFFEDIDGPFGHLEETRKACEELREWGQEWKEKAKEYYDEIKTLEAYMLLKGINVNKSV